MAGVKLNVPILNTQIKNAYYFNGRVLSAEAMQSEQTAARLHREQLAQGFGDGIVKGLNVSPKISTGTSSVTVSAGLAFNRLGQALVLPEATDIELTLATGQGDSAAADTGFDDCLTSHSNPIGDDAVATQLALYVLFLSPAIGYQGSVPMVGFDDSGMASQCRSEYIVEGVQFRLLKVGLEEGLFVNGETAEALNALEDFAGGGIAGGDLGFTQTGDYLLDKEIARSRFRNWVAHLFIGSRAYRELVRDPYVYANPLASYEPDQPGILQVLYENGYLAACDVPLAVVHFSASGIDFIDQWAVRRRVTRTIDVPGLINDRRFAEAEAAFAQFQAQIAYLTTPRGSAELQNVNKSELTSVQMKNLRAVDAFRYLPPVGIVPISEGGFLGVSETVFFDSLQIRNHPDEIEAPLLISGERVPTLIQHSLRYPAFDLTLDRFLWVYGIDENFMRLDEEEGNGEALKTARPCRVFASGYVPLFAEGRFDRDRYNYVNYILEDRDDL